MSGQDKEVRALYLKGIIPGKKAKIELTSSIGGRDTEGNYIHRAEKGDIVEATMTREGWVVALEGGDATVPLANGKLRQ